jgi:hypothetical protein
MDKNMFMAFTLAMCIYAGVIVINPLLGIAGIAYTVFIIALVYGANR